MLSTDQRSLFLEALYPPEGYAFDRGIGTTFTLDLLTLLMTPLALTLRDTSDAETVLADPVLFLESLQRFAERLTLFCQGGRISIPHQDSLLYRFLEPMVIEVQAPRAGVFHPKLWVLRYTAIGQPVLYRLLNLSRNLTFDKSWDLMVRLEGEVQDRAYGYSRNRPLGDFVAALPQLAVQPVASRVREDITLLEKELRRTDFQVPELFDQDSLEFFPAGIAGHMRGYAFDTLIRRALVVSPFLSDRILKQVASDSAENVLISRLESLAEISPQVLAQYPDCFVLDDADIDPEETATTVTTPDTDDSTPALSGLHAKLFILENGWDATWLQGSANATAAAFAAQNVEFMVALRGRRSKVGIDRVLGDDETGATLRALLRRYTLPEKPVAPREVGELDAEKLADAARCFLIRAGLELQVEGEYTLVLRYTPVDSVSLGKIDVYCWPISLAEQRAVPLLLTRATEIHFKDLSLEALTPFMAFRIEACAPGGRRHSLRFALKLPLAGLPEDRESRLVSAIISDREKFLRYLWLILADDSFGLPVWLQMTGSGTAEHAWQTSHDEMPLLESLVRTLSRSPQKIDRIAELVARLQSTTEGRAIFPAGFESLWEAIWHIRSKQP